MLRYILCGVPGCGSHLLVLVMLGYVLGYQHTTVYITPLGRFPKLDCSATKRAPIVPIPNDTSSAESSRRDISNADLFGTDPVSIVEMSIASVENQSDEGCVMV